MSRTKKMMVRGLLSRALLWVTDLLMWWVVCGIFALSWIATKPKKDNRSRNLEEITKMARMKRGVGYCEDTECEDYAKGVFLLNHGEKFYCPRCRRAGKQEREVGSFTGDGNVFKEVRIEYNFDPVHELYREIAIVRDEALWGPQSVYTLKSPLIKTEKRGLKVAEAILGNLNRQSAMARGDELPKTTETILSFDSPREEFSAHLNRLHADLEGSPLCRAQRVPVVTRREES